MSIHEKVCQAWNLRQAHEIYRRSRHGKIPVWIQASSLACLCLRRVRQIVVKICGVAYRSLAKNLPPLKCPQFRVHITMFIYSVILPSINAKYRLKQARRTHSKKWHIISFFVLGEYKTPLLTRYFSAWYDIGWVRINSGMLNSITALRPVCNSFPF